MFSVTRLGNLLHFGQLTIILPKSPKFLGIFCKIVEIFHFARETILDNFYGHLVIFLLVTLVACFKAE